VHMLSAERQDPTRPTSSHSPPFFMISSAMAEASPKVGTSFPTPLNEIPMSLARERESWALGLSPMMARRPGLEATSLLMAREMDEWIPPQRPPSEDTAR
jgi:hypothetical protein